MAETVFPIRGPLPALRDTRFACRRCGGTAWREARDTVAARDRLVCASCGYRRDARYLHAPVAKLP